ARDKAGRRGVLRARGEEGRARAAREPVPRVVEAARLRQRLPQTPGLRSQRDLLEGVRVEVAGARAVVPALGGDLRLPVAVAARKVDGRADRLVVEPRAPPVRALREFEHGE